MKVTLIAMLTIFSSTVMSADISNVCFTKAEKAVSALSNGYYDKNGFEAFDCNITANKAAVICEVSASKGDGAANDSFIVVLNKACTKVLRVELTGEE